VISNEIIKNVTLAIVLIITTVPNQTFQPDFQKDIVSGFNNLLENENQEIRVLTIQSMRALLLLSTKEDKEVSQIGQYYVRLFLPLLTTKLLLLSSKQICNDNMLICEELLKVYVVLAGSQTNPKQSN
jgi:hypothetical protein